eukprot:492747-Rhodomonas_salina.1
MADTGVSTTALKKACRKLGIMRWPMVNSASRHDEERGMQDRDCTDCTCASYTTQEFDTQEFETCCSFEPPEFESDFGNTLPRIDFAFIANEPLMTEDQVSMLWRTL